MTCRTGFCRTSCLITCIRARPAVQGSVKAGVSRGRIDREHADPGDQLKFDFIFESQSFEQLRGNGKGNVAPQPVSREPPGEYADVRWLVTAVLGLEYEHTEGGSLSPVHLRSRCNERRADHAAQQHSAAKASDLGVVVVTWIGMTQQRREASAYRPR